MSSVWLDLSGSSNILRPTYVSGFLDVSSTFLTRTDASMAGNVYIGGTAGLNVNNSMTMSGVINQLIASPMIGNVVTVGGNVSNDSYLNGRLYVYYDASINGRIFVTSDTSLNSKLFVGSDTSLNSRFFLGGDASLNSRLFVGSDSSLNSRLFLGGDASLNGNVYIGKDLLINGNMNVKQYTTNLTVYTVSYEFIVARDMSLNGNLTINSTTASTSTTTGALQVDGGAGIIGNLYAGSIYSLSPSTAFAIGSGNNFHSTAISAPPTMNGIWSGTGDNVTSSTFNLAIGSWNGIGFVDTCYKACYIYMDLRNGKINASSFNATSDYRIKTNVKELNDRFIVDNLRPVSYYNTIKKSNDIGFIAHEVQEHFPELVDGEKDGENNQVLNYIGLIGVLTKEIQDLKKENKRILERLEKAGI